MLSSPAEDAPPTADSEGASDNKDSSEQPPSTATAKSDEGSSVPTVPVQTAKMKHRKEDFELGQLLGDGAFAKVVEGTVINEKSPQFGCKYAVKVMDKRHIMKNDKIKYVCVC